jgi:hypothetical protein
VHANEAICHAGIAAAGSFGAQSGGVLNRNTGTAIVGMNSSGALRCVAVTGNFSLESSPLGMVNFLPIDQLIAVNASGFRSH